jgi:hypothetical protein
MTQLGHKLGFYLLPRKCRVKSTPITIKSSKEQDSILSTVTDPIKLYFFDNKEFFLSFATKQGYFIINDLFFATRLGYFIINDFFPICKTNSK